MQEFIVTNYTWISAGLVLITTAVCAYIGHRRAWEIDENDIVIRRAVNNRSKEHYNPGAIAAVVIIILVWVLAFMVFKDTFL